MSTIRILTAAAFATVFAVSAASAQQAQRINGTIDKVEGNTLFIKAESGPVTLKLADNSLIVGVVKASIADIKQGAYIGSGAVPQPDGSQKASRCTSSTRACAAPAMGIVRVGPAPRTAP
jgi:hypothetical protein